MDSDNVNELFKKFQKGQATKQETLALFKAMNMSVDICRMTIEEVKKESAN